MSTEKKEFVNVKIKAGNIFYVSSKEPFDGAVMVETKFGEYYHKELPIIESPKLLSVKLVEGKFGESLKFLMEGEDGSVLDLSMVTINQKGGLDSFAADVAKTLPNLEIGKPITISLNKESANAAGYLYPNVYIKQDEDENVRWAFGIDEIPKLVQKINKVTKKTEYDSEDRDAFLYDKIKEACKKLKGARPQNDNYPKAKQDIAVSTINDDDLPF